MDVSFVKFLVKLAEVTEGKIAARVKQLSGYTLKHWGGMQPQEPHGWRYGANILRPNGMGKASVERGRAYLGRVTDRDLDSKLTGKRVAAGAANNRGINNYHMEYQKRSRGGDSKLRRWNKGERDREYGNSLSDQKGLGTGRAGKTSGVGKNTPSNFGKGQKWAKNSAKLIDPTKSYWDLSNRVHGGKGKSNPWTKQRSVQERRDEARQEIRGVRKSPIARSENPKVLARQISATGGRKGLKPGDLYGRGNTNKRASFDSAKVRNADANKKAPRVKTEAAKLRDIERKRATRAANKLAGTPEVKKRFDDLQRERRAKKAGAGESTKELSVVNPILGRLMDAAHARVEGVLLEKHKELYVPDEHTSPYRELVTYKAKSKTTDTNRDKGEYDEEGGMAKSQLKSVIRNAKLIHDGLQDDTNIAEWAQSKLSLAEDYISTVANYMLNEENGTAKKEGKGLWSNIHAKRERGEKPAKPGHKDYPNKLVFQKLSKAAKKERKNFYDIKINPENIGKFTATQKRTGKSTEELTQSDNPLTKKRAVFAKNALQWGK